MTRNKNAKLTPTKVNVRLASGRTIQAVRHKNLVPRPAASTPPAGPAVLPAPITAPVFYAKTMGGFAPKSVLDEEGADDACAKTYRETLESRDAWGKAVSVDVEWRPLQLEFDEEHLGAWVSNGKA